MGLLLSNVRGLKDFRKKRSLPVPEGPMTIVVKCKHVSVDDGVPA